MTTGPDLRIATLNDARSRRSAEKRAAVEDAIKRLRDTRQAVTFVSVAREAKVSRQVPLYQSGHNARAYPNPKARHRLH